MRVEEGETLGAGAARPWALLVGLLAAVAWLSCTAAPSLVRGGGRRRRQPGTPAPWKWILWLLLLCACVVMVGVAGAY